MHLSHLLHLPDLQYPADRSVRLYLPHRQDRVCLGDRLVPADPDSLGYPEHPVDPSDPSDPSDRECPDTAAQAEDKVVPAEDKAVPADTDSASIPFARLRCK